jgi:hypothetical protein
MTTYPTGQVALSFQRETAQVATTGRVSLSLDDAKNLSVYGEAKTTFKAGETAYLKLHEAESGYSVDCSAGSVSREAANIAHPYTEDIDFALTAEGELQQIADPACAISYLWLGKSGGAPLFSGRGVVLPSIVTARILRCNYKSLGDRLKLHVSAANMGPHAEMDVLVVVYKDDKVLASITVAYETGVIEPVPVELSVADFCSDEIVENVNVFLDGKFIGQTGEDGKIFLGYLIPGRTYQLK